MTGALAPTKPLTALDVCDRCGAQAYVRVLLANSGERRFCAHHGREHAAALVGLDPTEHTRATERGGRLDRRGFMKLVARAEGLSVRREHDGG